MCSCKASRLLEAEVEAVAAPVAAMAAEAEVKALVEEVMAREVAEMETAAARAHKMLPVGLIRSCSLHLRTLDAICSFCLIHVGSSIQPYSYLHTKLDSQLRCPIFSYLPSCLYIPGLQSMWHMHLLLDLYTS